MSILECLFSQSTKLLSPFSTDPFIHYWDNLSLVRRPHPRGGKGSGELGQNPWACAEEFPHANEIVALAQSYDKLTAGMQHRYTVCIAIQFRRPIRFKACFTTDCACNHMQTTKVCMALSAHMRMHRRTRTEDPAHSLIFVSISSFPISRFSFPHSYF